MAVLKKLKTAFGGDDPDLMATGQLGRALVKNIGVSGSSVQRGGPPEQVCVFTLEVYLDDTPPFVTQIRKRLPQYAIAQIIPDATFVAVRVDPKNHSRVGIDLSIEPPTVRMAASADHGSISAMLANGKPCQAVIVQSQPLGTIDWVAALTQAASGT